jgi:type I restriction enzyme, R subunit
LSTPSTTFWALQSYLREINAPYKAIVAFSGSKDHKGGANMTKPSLNGFPSRDIEEKFEEDAVPLFDRGRKIPDRL